MISLAGRDILHSAKALSANSRFSIVRSLP